MGAGFVHEGDFRFELVERSHYSDWVEMTGEWIRQEARECAAGMRCRRGGAARQSGKSVRRSDELNIGK